MSKHEDDRSVLRDKFFLKIELRHPFLYPLIRQLWFERWFRLICLALCAALIGGTLFIVKIWRTTPRGFRPEVHVSGIDLFRARALKRSALKLAAQGRGDEALQSWMMAAANDPGDPEVLRGVLRDLAEGSGAAQYSAVSQRFGNWLLRLRGTNVPDIELVTDVYEKERLDEVTVSTLKYCNQTLTHKLEATYLKALFNSGDTAGFDSLWRRIENTPETAANHELQLYHAAFVAGWGDQEPSFQASRILDEALTHPETAELIHRLRLQVSLQRLDDRSYGTSLDYLRRNLRATLKDELGYWELLVRIGRKQEAISLIHASGLKPSSGEEAVQLSKVYFDAGLNQEAGDILRMYSPAFPSSQGLWVSYANWLIEQKRWEELRGYALELRRPANPLHGMLEGYGHYLEGRAELGLGRRETAELQFDTLHPNQFDNKMIATLVAINLMQLGYSKPATKILSALEPELAADPEYWSLLSKNAYDLRDANLLHYALKKSYELKPDDAAIVNNYAAVLISFREKPEKAIQLTMRMMSILPNSAIVRINHACALLQNKRTAEARRLLASVNPKSLNAMEASAYYLAAFEAALEAHDATEALRVSKKVDSTLLLSPDKVWFDNALTNLPALKPI